MMNIENVKKVTELLESLRGINIDKKVWMNFFRSTENKRDLRFPFNL